MIAWYSRERSSFNSSISRLRFNLSLIGLISSLKVWPEGYRRLRRRSLPRLTNGRDDVEAAVRRALAQSAATPQDRRDQAWQEGAPEWETHLIDRCHRHGQSIATESPQSPVQRPGLRANAGPRRLKAQPRRNGRDWRRNRSKRGADRAPPPAAEGEVDLTVIGWGCAGRKKVREHVRPKPVPRHEHD